MVINAPESENIRTEDLTKMGIVSSCFFFFSFCFRTNEKTCHFLREREIERRDVLMVSTLDSGARGPGSSPGRVICVVFLGKALYSHSASLHPGV